MDSVLREALIVALTDALRVHKSWCGETHLQKSTYFLQAVTGVPMEFGFILFRHGPFSFDLRTELTTMRANDFLTLESSEEYGPRFRSTGLGIALQELCEEKVRRHEPAIEFISCWLGPKNVALLERVATAHWVMAHQPEKSEGEQAKEVSRLKPHIPAEQALLAIREVAQKVREAPALL